MSNINVLQEFGKGIDNSKQRNGLNAVIYTRVSSKEQMDNMSLETQMKACTLYANKLKYSISGFFGGTYESAQTDERKQFIKMVSFVKSSKEKVSYIIVYSLERFSRTGDNAIWLSRQLRELGISIISVTQPIDTSNPSGVLQQNILFLFSQYDNDLRRQKSVAGMKEKLLKGERMGIPPIGYSYGHGRKETQKVIINEKGKFVEQAFLMKVKQKLSNAEIAIKLKSMGFAIPRQTLTDMLRNVFYCGYISHNFLEGQVIKGKHPAIVSEEIFLQAQEVMKGNTVGFKQNQQEEFLPLKRFIRCSVCNTPLTGYIVKRKKLHYYKCNKLNCKCNRSAKLMHDKFMFLLSKFELQKELSIPLQDLLINVYEEQTLQSKEDRKALKQRLSELSSKLETIEERFALGEIDRGVYEKFAGKLRIEIEPLKKEAESIDKKLSNPEKLIENCVNICSNLQEMWKLENSIGKQKLQNLVFPDGIVFDREIDDYRTEKVNLIFEITQIFSESYNKNKTGIKEDFPNMPG